MNGLSLGLEVLGGEDAETQEVQEAPEVKEEIIADETEAKAVLSDVESLEEKPEEEAKEEN
jgi:hypothetical protein